MANPELIDGYDKNDTNTAPVPDFLKNDGYADGQTVEAYEHNEMFKQLFAAANKNKNDGVWEWEDPTAPDATTEYNTGSLITYNGELFISLVELNEETPANDGINWRSYDLASYVKLWQNQAVTITPPSDADYTLTATENGYGRLVLVDGSWTATHNIIVDDTERSFIVDNSAGTYTATVKTSAGTGIPVLAGTKVWLLCDATKVIKSIDLETVWVANDSRAKTALNASGNAPIYACRAWVNFNGTGTVAIRASGNVSSITDNGVGNYTVNFTIAMPDTNYSISMSVRADYVAEEPQNIVNESQYVRTTNSFGILTGYGNESSLVVTDNTVINATIFR